jgi:hypothetical protein
MSAVLPELEEQLAAATRRRAALAAAPPAHRRVRRRIAPRRALTLATLLAAVLVAAVALVPGRSGHLPSDLAARAYTAATRPGLVHWRIDIEGYVNGRFATHQRTEGWKLGDVTHTLHSDVVHGKQHVTVDERVSGRHARAWMSASDDFVSSTRGRTGDRVELIPSGDPLAAFRAAYRAGRLRALGGGRFDLRFADAAPGTLTYEVDPATGRPRRLTITGPPQTIGTRRIVSKTIVLFSAYETLTPTAANRAKLALRPHPGAGPGVTSATALFAALRTGRAPTGPIGRQLGALAGHMKRFHIDPAGIRPVAEDIWLAPGRGYVCLYVASAPAPTGGARAIGGVGGGCTTTTVAARRGVSISVPSTNHPKPGALPVLHTLLVVPDDVRAVRLKSGRTLTPVHGLVRLPPRSFNPRLLR